MSLRLWLNLGLLLVLGALLALVMYEPGLPGDVAPPTVSGLAGENIEHIRIQRPGHEDIELERRGEDWWLTGPPAIPADELQVRRLLALAEARAVRSYASGDMDLNALGLAPAQTSLIYNRHQRLELGTTEALQQLRYVHSDDQVYLISDLAPQLATASSSSLASRRLLPPGAIIEALVLPAFSLHRDSPMHWRLTPDRPNLDADTIQTLVDAWSQSRALWVSRAREVTEMQQTLSVYLAGDTLPVLFHLQSREPQLVLVRRDLGLAYQLGAGAAEQLLALHATPPETDEDPAP